MCCSQVNETPMCPFKSLSSLFEWWSLSLFLRCVCTPLLPPVDHHITLTAVTALWELRVGAEPHRKAQCSLTQSEMYWVKWLVVYY